MNDNNFDDPEIANHWIKSIESVGARIRETDIYPLIREWLNVHKSYEILEIGCGQGAASVTIPDHSNYIGIDPSPLLLARANELYNKPNNKFNMGNAYSLPFQDQQFDAIFSVTVWHLLKNINLAASELTRTLKSNGHFLIITANPDAYTLWEKIFTEHKRFGNRLEGAMIENGKVVAKDVLYLHTMDELIKSLESMGLMVSKIISFRSEVGSDLKQYVGIFGNKA
jgi:ubiquinone/menaquinone biosynthesis C-methylase UbiE